MGFARKHTLIKAMAPHIAVIPESSRRDIESAADESTQICWFGENPRKGLGVLVSAPWRIRRMGKPCKKLLIPLWLEGPFDFLLVAVWTMRVNTYQRSYIGQACEAVKENPQWFDLGPAVVCGDFNSNSIWDDTRKKANHTWLVNYLSERSIVSAYHHFFSEMQGAETRPTHYFYHKQERPFHIDYIFLPKEWNPKLTRVKVGEHGHWAKHSDHVPILADLQF